MIGAVKLTTVDSIGVAVFSADNALLVPKMDGDFRVVEFLDFYNEQAFEIHYDLPAHYKGREVSVGDPAPVPFWNEGVCNIIEGDAEKALVEKTFGTRARTSAVLQDLGRMLDDARSGRIKAQIAEWEAADLAAGFDDVFLEPPSRTRYWITRYRVALQNARKLANPPHPIDVRLRNAAHQWLSLYATKSEPVMLGSLLGSAAQGIFSGEQIKNILFAYIVHKLAVNSSDLELIFREGTAMIFQTGIYNHYLKCGWPRVPFKYMHVDFLELMKDAVNRGKERGKYGGAIKLSRVLFGSEDAPHEIDDYVMLFLERALHEFKAIKGRYGEEYKQFPLSTDSEGWARAILEKYVVLEQLSRIIVGKDRVAGHMLDGRFGVDTDEIDEWRTRLGVQSPE